MSLRSAARPFAVCAIVVATAVSCGGSSGDDADSVSHPATEEGLEDAAEEISLLLFSDPSEGYKMLSEECHDDVSRAEWLTTLEFASEFFEGFYGFPPKDVGVGEVEVRNVTETSGEASI